MTTKDKINNLEQEVKLLRSALISQVGKDKEGRYRPELSQDIFQALSESHEFEFTNKEQFLAQLNGAV